MGDAVKNELLEDQPLKRYAFLLRLREGAAEAYEEAHRAVWPEMLALLKSAGISEYSIYRRDDLLILALRAADFETTWSRIEKRSSQSALAGGDGALLCAA